MESYGNVFAWQKECSGCNNFVKSDQSPFLLFAFFGEITFKDSQKKIMISILEQNFLGTRWSTKDGLIFEGPFIGKNTAFRM